MIIEVLLLLPISNGNLKFNFRKGHYTIDWSFLELFHDVNLAVDALYKRICEVLDIFVPKILCNCNKLSPKWFTNEICKNLKLKQNHFRWRRRIRNKYNRSEFERLRRIIKTDISMAYQSHVLRSMKSMIKSDFRSFWQFGKLKKNSRRIRGVRHDSDAEFNTPQSIVNAFASTFSSVFKMGTLSN